MIRGQNLRMNGRTEMLNPQPLVKTVDAPPVRADRSAWLVSLFVHLVFLVVVSYLTLQVDFAPPELVLTTYVPDPVELKELKPDELHFDPTPREAIGATAMGGLEDESSGRAEIPPMPQVPSLDVPPVAAVGQIQARELFEATTSVEADLNHSVKGAAGVAVTGADGAIERLSHEILASLDERRTLVVWFFDQSGSLQTQRKAILQRFNRVYEELGAVEASLAKKEKPKADQKDSPLLTSVVSFGNNVRFRLDQPTSDLERITDAVAAIERDESGVERVFTAVQKAVTRYRKFRSQGRNVIFILFTDEAGDDTDQLDPTVDLCRRFEIPVYVVGVPAPFGRRETLVKWVDPNPKYDQSVQWGRVDQGPESYRPERVKILFNGFREDKTPIDSGFGPFALTRLCYETGGIYFTVHPNRRLGRRIRHGDTKKYTAHFSVFFDPDVMRRYRPEYVSGREYMRQVEESRLRTALLAAAEHSWVEPLDPPRRRFVVRREAEFVKDLTEAQKSAARLSPVAEHLYTILKDGDVDRPREITPRWQAGFDLAVGRVLATKVRAEGYNVMLAKAKRGMKFGQPKNNTWVLESSDQLDVGSRLGREAELAREYLERVTDQHAGTPWAHLAKLELKIPLGWRWKEVFTPIRPPANRMAANNNNQRRMPSDDKARKLAPRRKKRPPPKL